MFLPPLNTASIIWVTLKGWSSAWHCIPNSHLSMSPRPVTTRKSHQIVWICFRTYHPSEVNMQHIFHWKSLTQVGPPLGPLYTLWAVAARNMQQNPRLSSLNLLKNHECMASICSEKPILNNFISYTFVQLGNHQICLSPPQRAVTAN